MLLLLPILPAMGQTPQIETLNRSVVAVNMSKSEGQKKSGIFLSWRFLDGDEKSTAFNVYRDGTLLTAKPLTSVTNYTDTEGSTSSQYVVETLVDDVVTERDTVKEIWPTIYKEIPLNRPAGGKNASGYYSYSPNDCSAGDVDGDGEYEIIVKWDPTDSQDNSNSGYTGNVYLDCYKLDGTQLWRIDLGQNIRAGAHYTQFMVYDLDGDGKAEVACKTAPGTIDGEGNYVLMGSDDPTADYRNSSGYILSGPEYLTVFNGETGAEITTVAYNPLRGTVSSWGDSYGNRVDRFLACIAYLDGIHPSLVMCRGYYTRAALVAYDFDGTTLTQRWIHDSATSGQGAYGQGNHNLSVGDVDDDGYDEIIYGSCAIDHDGTLLYRTGLGHGDAIHFSDLDPDIDGLEVFTPHEETSAKYGFDIHEAGTGNILYGEYTGSDVGRAMAADIDSTSRGFEFWSSANSNVYDCHGNVLYSSNQPSYNFRVYWDGDLLDELLDGDKLDKWNSSTGKSERIFTLYNYDNAMTCNGTKKTPNLQADLFGDWREEIVLWGGGDSSSLIVFTTTYASDYRLITPMQDHIYRMGIAWQNVAYNQPPHLGYYIGDGIDPTAARLTKTGKGNLVQTIEEKEAIDTICYSWTYADGVTVDGQLPDGVTATIDLEKATVTICGVAEETGTFSFYISTYGGTTDISLPGTITVRPESVLTEVALFHFDETSGLTAKNEISGEATAESLTPSWVSGVSGNAISFPGTTGYLLQSHYDALEMGTGPFSITLWFKSPGASSCDWYLFHKGSHTADTSTGATGKWIGIEYKNGNLTFAIDDDVTKTNLDITASDYFDNEWHFLTCVRDSVNGQLLMYLDGEVVGTKSDGTGNIFETEDMVIGNRNILFDNAYIGALDELTIYTGALTAAKVRALYEAQRPTSGVNQPTVVPVTERVKVFPTTFDDQITILLNEISDENVTFIIHAIDGREVYRRTYFIENQSPLTISGMRDWTEGLYTLTVVTSEGTFTRKLLKK
ncbi:MAG: T9SS type A sorting domain-containing protein [Porphyromonadaceae bacterium]|nr:T9SS type A sorting domain-containing protein [Porphyromonadaceae bacterium]